MGAARRPSGKARRRRTGVSQSDISVGDTTGNFPNHLYEYLTDPPVKGGGGGELVAVNYISKHALWRRDMDTYSGVPLYFSTPMAAGKKQDYVPVTYANADYFINVAILKTHQRAGVTLCGKNLFGSMIRTPRPEDDSGYFDLHDALPSEAAVPEGSYSPIVDLMGHEALGGKSLLSLIDGLWGGYDWSEVSPPLRWVSPPFGEDYKGDIDETARGWASSILLSQDPVAVDSVAYDIWRSEAAMTELPEIDPRIPGGDNYLHEAALADAPPSGTVYDPENDGIPLSSLGVHEHWNNDLERQYAGNLGIGPGIELVEVHAAVPGCGDNLLQAGEVCDDGNRIDHDGCSTACQPDEIISDTATETDRDFDSDPSTHSDGGDKPTKDAADAEPNDTPTPKPVDASESAADVGTDADTAVDGGSRIPSDSNNADAVTAVSGACQCRVAAQRGDCVWKLLWQVLSGVFQ